MVSFQRPLARRALRTRRPLRVDMRFMKPCSRLRGMRLGCQVRFIKKPCTPPLKIVLSIIAAKPMLCQSGIANLGLSQQYLAILLTTCFPELRDHAYSQPARVVKRMISIFRIIYGKSRAWVPFYRRMPPEWVLWRHSSDRHPTLL
jgi:hypothetical protein